MRRSIAAALGAAVIATFVASSAAEAIIIDFSFSNLGGTITHNGASLHESSEVDFDGASFLVTEAGTGGDASGLSPGDFLNLSADTSPVSKDIIYGFGDMPSDFPMSLGANVILTWPIGAGPSVDVFTETLTTVTSINRGTPDAITVTMSGTVKDSKGLFTAGTPVQLIMTASHAGGSGDVGAEFTNTSNLAPSIPEPSTWVMMGFGFGALGLVASRQRKANRALLTI
jgi:PEP-CTERM motif